MHEEHWRPRCSRPTDLRAPVRLDPTGVVGPTRSQARSSRWRRVAHGWYVADADRPDVVEQRILEQAARLPVDGAVTGWASLRWRGGGFFDGTDHGGRRRLPIPLVIGPQGNLRRSAQVALSWEQLAPWEREVVDGLPCASAQRSVFDEMRRRGSLRAGVIAADMAIAAGLITQHELASYVEIRPAWTGVPRVRQMLALVDGASVSPQESALRLVWTLDAGLPRPLSNPDLVSDAGRFIGRPDLLDPTVGLVGEYDGADHLALDRRRQDRQREERFRDHGLECFTVVRGELGQPAMVAHRIRAAYERARTSTLPRRWHVA